MSVLWLFGTVVLGDTLHNLKTVWELRDVEYDRQELHEIEDDALTRNQQYFLLKQALRNAQGAGKEAEKDANTLREFLQKEFLDKKADASHALKRSAIVALMPPCFVLLIGFLALWVIRGWRTT